MNKHDISPSGWLSEAIHCPSPNYTEGIDREISLIVVHNISLPPFEYGQNAVTELFTNQLHTHKDPFFQYIQHLRVSSHLFIDRKGQITQYVSFLDIAYHAGVSSFCGRTECNHFSIGIELEGCDFEPFTTEQYKQLTITLNKLKNFYPIKYITGHQHIAPERKTDPGHFFDWQLLHDAGLPLYFDQ